jgi:hypothetical protein
MPRPPAASSRGAPAEGGHGSASRISPGCSASAASRRWRCSRAAAKSRASRGRWMPAASFLGYNPGARRLSARSAIVEAASPTHPARRTACPRNSSTNAVSKMRSSSRASCTSPTRLTFFFSLGTAVDPGADRQLHQAPGNRRHHRLFPPQLDDPLVLVVRGVDGGGWVFLALPSSAFRWPGWWAWWRGCGWLTGSSGASWT